MSLSIGEDVLLWQLRLSHLRDVKDVITQRLISLDVSVHNDPVLRAAGFEFEPIPRTYSPPISTDGGLGSDYLNKSAIKARRDSESRKNHFPNEVDPNAQVPIGGDSSKPLSTIQRLRNGGHEEDDSSDLSDDSEDDVDESRRAAQHVKFAVKDRQHSASPEPRRAGTPVQVSRTARTRARSISADLIHDGSSESAATSHGQSSDAEISSPIPGLALASGKGHIVKDGKLVVADSALPIDFKSAASSLSSGFGDLADSASLLDGPEAMLLGVDSLADDLVALPSHNPPFSSPKTSRPAEMLQTLPPARPISRVLPSSVLGKAITALREKPRNPLQQFAKFAGQGSQNPLSIKILAPFSSDREVIFDVDMQNMVANEISGAPQPVTVADAIGFCLYRYCELGLAPAVEPMKLDVNRWCLRIVDDGEVEYDFPPLLRTANVIDFTSNNDRPLRGRRTKTFDVFALVEASPAEYEENKKVTPKYSKLFDDFMRASPATLDQNSVKNSRQVRSDGHTKPHNVESNRLPYDQGNASMHVTQRQGASTSLKIRFVEMEGVLSLLELEIPADTYIAEIVEIACKKWSLDKANYYLRITGTSMLIPSDRFVKVLGEHRDLELVRRKYASEASLGYPGSFTSSTPAERLLIGDKETISSVNSRSRHTIPIPGDTILPVYTHTAMQDLWGNSREFKKWNVMRKQPMSFTATHARTIMVDSDYLHILPGESGKTMFDTSGKTTTIPYSMIVGCKVSRRHPKSFRIVVFREKETKRYDFEAVDDKEAQEIVTEIRKGMEPFHALTGRNPAQ